MLVPVASTVEPDCERGLRELERRGFAVRRAFGHSAIDVGRSMMASEALRDGFDEMMWIDSDIGFHPDDVDTLRRHGLPLSLGLYAKKNCRGFACHLLPGTDHLVFGSGGGLREIQYAGFGFVHTRRELFDRIRAQSRLPDCNQRFGAPFTPWFLPELVPDGEGLWYLAEDFAFCHRARRAGCPVMADTTIRLVHVGRRGYTWEDISTETKPSYSTFELRFASSSESTSTPSPRPIPKEDAGLEADRPTVRPISAVVPVDGPRPQPRVGKFQIG